MESKFKEGDKVRLVKRELTKEEEENTGWNEEMDDYIGIEGVIGCVSTMIDSIDYRLEDVNGEYYDFWIPESCLELVEETEKWEDNTSPTFIGELSKSTSEKQKDWTQGITEAKKNGTYLDYRTIKDSMDNPIKSFNTTPISINGKWFIEVTDNNYEMLRDWVLSREDFNKEFTENVRSKHQFRYVLGDGYRDKSYFFALIDANNKLKHRGYSEITTEQFIKHVWNEKALNSLPDTAEEYLAEEDRFVVESLSQFDGCSIEQVYKGLLEMQKVKDKRYGNSALKPLDIFAKHHNYGSRIDEKLARVKNAEGLRKNDVADIIGGLILICKDNNWYDFKDLID